MTGANFTSARLVPCGVGSISQSFSSRNFEVDQMFQAGTFATFYPMKIALEGIDTSSTGTVLAT